VTARLSSPRLPRSRTTDRGWRRLEPRQGALQGVAAAARALPAQLSRLEVGGDDLFLPGIDEASSTLSIAAKVAVGSVPPCGSATSSTSEHLGIVGRGPRE